MKKWLSILLVLALALGLCACGGAAQPAGTDNGGVEDATEAVPAEAAPEDAESAAEEAEPAEPGQMYIHQEKEMLVRKTIWGQDPPSTENTVLGRVFDVVTEYIYDDFGELKEEKESLVYPNETLFQYDGREFDGYTYIYDDAGSVESVTTVAHYTYNNGSVSVGERYTFKDGRIIKAEDVVFETGKVSKEMNYTYGGSGQVIREEQITYARDTIGGPAFIDTPFTDLYDYDEDGYCTRWEHREGEDVLTADYAYNSDKNVTRCAYTLNGEDHGVYEMHFENGVQTRTTGTKDGVTTVYEYSYDNQGRPAAINYDWDGKHADLQFTYNEDGFLSLADWVVDEQSTGKTVYKYEEKSDGDIVGSFEGDNGPFVFGPNTHYMYFFGDFTQGNRLTQHWDHVLKPVLTTLQYVKTRTRYSYEPVSILVEANPSSFQTDVSIEAFYPPMPESYEGIPAPVPDGTQRLSKVSMESFPSLPIVTKISYGETGDVTGAESYFDAMGAYDLNSYMEGTEADEQGRLIKLVPGPTVYEYAYGDDPGSYKMIMNYQDGTSEETELLLADWQITDYVGRAMEECVRDAYISADGTFEYNEEGLPVHMLYEVEYSDGEKKTVEHTYTYTCETWEDGSLKNVVRHDSESEYPATIYRFDKHGYLTEYEYSNHLSMNTYFDYEYEPVG